MNRENEIYNVRIDEIIPNRFQPRLEFNEKELDNLAESIKLHGIIQPLVLRRVGDKFEIIAGERRYKASVKAGLQTVPAVIMNIDDKQSAEVAVVENLQRKNLTAIEEAQSYKKILDMGYLTQEQLAQRMGVSQPTIANKLRLLSLTIQVKEALLKNQISERHARSLLLLTDANMQINMLNRIINERLTVRQTDEEIAKILGKTINNTPTQQQYPEKIETLDTNEKIETLETPMSTQTPVEPTPVVNEPINIAPAFDVDTNKIRNEAENIIPVHKEADINMLLRTESQEKSATEQPKNTSLEDQKTNLDMGNIVGTNKMSINPFEEVETETLDFDIPNKPITNVENTYENNANSLIEEFKKQQGTTQEINSEPNISEEKSISTAINKARNEVRAIEDLGFDVETEEFDFEDMYQIIIKIKKD